MLTTGPRTGDMKAVTITIANGSKATIRDVAVPLFAHANAYHTNNYSFSVAEMFGASVTGFAICPSLILPVTGPFDSIPGPLIDELMAQSETEGRENAHQFEHQATLRNLPVVTRVIRAGASDASQHFASLARNFDVSVVPQAKDGDNDFAEATVFGAGRPAIIVPYIHQTAISLSRMLVCWDGSRAAARAIGDAWPLLERASSVEIVSVGNKDKLADSHYWLGEHFAQHGVTARLTVLDPADNDVGNVILSYAADAGTSIIVMGAYGHSRTREWILGGVTQTILKTMTVPVLMSH